MGLLRMQRRGFGLVLERHRQIEAVLLQKRMTPRGLEVLGDHLGAHLARGDLRLPAQFSLALVGSPSSVSTSAGRK
jgi:hypothetical protein